MSADLDAELLQFIDERISSVGLLEVLERLRDDPERAWSVEELTVDMRTSEPAAVKHLQDLVSQGLAAVTPEGEVRYRYRPASAWLDSMSQRLIECYRSRRVSITRAIHSRSGQDASLRRFSDAFRIRED